VSSVVRILKKLSNPFEKTNLTDLIDSNRKKNGRVNLSEIGRQISRDADTVRRHIIKNGLSEYAELEIK